MPSTTTDRGSAERWGPLWGARAADWAATEEQQVPTYQAALARIGIQPGQGVLDIGCGTGAFLHLAAQHGAQPYGVDASPALLEIARRRVPAAQLHAGEMQSLPFDDDSFDLVSGFTRWPARTREDGARVVLRDVRDGSSRVVHARYLVAADGAHSPCGRGWASA